MLGCEQKMRKLKLNCTTPRRWSSLDHLTWIVIQNWPQVFETTMMAAELFESSSIAMSFSMERHSWNK